MSLSCSCDWERDYETGEWCYYPDADEYLIPFKKSRRKRCSSCGKLINIKELCNVYGRRRYPYDEIEARKKCGLDLDGCFGDEPHIPIAPYYHCERCSEIFLNLVDIGYKCVMPHENMEELLKEYHDLSGFKRG